MITRNARRLVGLSLACFFFLLAALAVDANAAMVIGLVLDPATTAGGGATSTRSGPGTWQLFQVDDTPGHYGIGTYNITMSGATAINNRAPLTTILDNNGDPQPAGFGNLRTATNANPIQAGQVLPGQSPYYIRGFGRDASDFATQATAMVPGSTVVGPSISPAWGSYDTIAPYNGKSWLLIAEGTYNGGTPPSVTSAIFNVHTSPTQFTNILVSEFTLLVIPEPTTLALTSLSMLAMLSVRTRNRGSRNATPILEALGGVQPNLGEAQIVSPRIIRRATMALIGFALAALLSATEVEASVILNLLINPTSTAGGGSTSTRSGPGSFQIYAIDTAGHGISSYNLSMGPAVTASNNRTPVSTIQDGNSDIFSVGFSLLRTPSNAPQMQGSQSLPSMTPYLIAGMGQTTGSFAAIAAASPYQPATIFGPTTSGAWGGPYNGINSGTKKWLFIGEGLWNTALPVTSHTQFISSASFTVYSDSQFNSTATDTLFPCLLNCRAPTVVDAEFSNVDAENPGMMAHTFWSSGSSPVIWDYFTFDSFTPLPGGSGAGPAIPATFDYGTAKFSWNTVGSAPGTYKWLVTASNPFGIDQGSVTVHVAAIPEPASVVLVGCATVLLGFARIYRDRLVL